MNSSSNQLLNAITWNSLGMQPVWSKSKQRIGFAFREVKSLIRTVYYLENTQWIKAPKINNSEVALLLSEEVLDREGNLASDELVNLENLVEVDYQHILQPQYKSAPYFIVSIPNDNGPPFGIAFLNGHSFCKFIMQKQFFDELPVRRLS